MPTPSTQQAARRSMPGFVLAAVCLALAAPGAAVHATDDALDRPRLRILQECRRQARRPEVGVEQFGVAGPREQAAVVPEGRRRQNKNVYQIGRINAHRGMVP